VKTTTLPSAEQLKQLDEGVQTGARDAIAIGRIAAERSAGTLAAKAASARRELARAAAAGAGKERLEHLRAQAAAYAARAGQGAEQLKMARTLEKIGAAYGQRPAAYGRAVDERGRGHAGLSVALVTERGETLVAGRTDEEGYFALSLAATPDVAGDVLLRLGEGGSLGSFPVTNNGRLLPPREILFSGPRGGRDTTEPPKKD
jgi:hypothetical protein